MEFEVFFGGQRIGYAENPKFEIEREIKETFVPSMFSSLDFEVPIKSATWNYVSFANLLGKDEATVKSILKLQNILLHTKNKRIKNKLDKRINELLF